MCRDSLYPCNKYLAWVRLQIFRVYPCEVCLALQKYEGTEIRSLHLCDHLVGGMWMCRDSGTVFM